MLGPPRSAARVLRRGAPRGAYPGSPRTWEGWWLRPSPRSSTDSGLEAFSRNPTDGSFAPPAFQPGAKANCPNRRFLSY